MAKSAAVAELNAVSNDGQFAILEPYIAEVSIQGIAAFLFHRWSVDGVEAKANAAKGSKAKKTDDVESYVYRLDNNNIAIPSEYLRMSVIHAAKYKQDPRSPRKSAMDLFKAGVTCLDELCDTGLKDWDYIDRRRVQVQRNAITRHRPALKAGWQISVRLQVLLPEYISPALLNDAIQSAGKLIGLGDFRPTFGRFIITSFEVK
jgi:hypothetical protein